MMYPPQPFGDAPLWGIHPNEPALSVLEREAPTRIEEASVHLAKLTSKGDTIFSRYLSYVPVPLTSAETDSTLNAQVNQWAEWGVMGGVPAARLRSWAEPQLYTPPFRPPLTGMVLGQDGGYWLRGIPLDEESVEWYSLDSAGTPLGQVRLPVGFTMLVADAATLWGTVSDELDVPYLVRFRIRRGGN